ncbi:hypothetical protein [Psychromonas hadalis]|uniref:hypothetical protein n=1 Tax=Psychromonas hadalis TaxID=211669 RepID=UPI0003B36D99|nr:hypothetical protein [Psychromonas hadalis]
MKNSLVPCLLCYLCSGPLFAYPNPQSLPWLAPMLIEDASHWPIETLNEMQGLFDCGELQGKQYCSAPVNYYKTEVESTLWLKSGLVDVVEVLSPFSALSYSELQLNLRKDGFVLAWIKIGEKSIDIIDELKHKALYKVDREVVMFMNKGAIDTPRQLIWYPKAEYYATQQSRYVEFLSDGKIVTVRFVRGDDLAHR